MDKNIKKNETTAEKRALIDMVISCVAFGTVGIFRRFIPLDSGLIAFVRGLLGGLFLILLLLIRKKPFSFKHFNLKTLILLIVTGGVMGFNWIALFEAYNHTTVATATLCYYMEPFFLLIISAFLFKEVPSLKKIICIIVAFVGMIFVSGITESGFDFGGANMKGIMLGLLSGLMYAIVVIMNKTVQGCDIYEKAAVELLAASLCVFPYLLIKGVFNDPATIAGITPVSVLLLVFVGVFITGYIYAIYFGAVEKLKVQQTAILGYIDPAVAIILSALILGESMTPLGILGAVLIIGASLVSELT